MSLDPFTLGIIGGGGWLGRALAEAVVDHKIVDAGALTLSSRTPSDARAGSRLAARWTADNQALVAASELVILSVRPEQLAGVQISARGKTIVSFLAGTPMRHLADRLGTDRIVRAMPNAAMSIGRSYTAWVATPDVPEVDRDRVRAILLACGEADEAPSEAMIDYLTGLTGSGPAFPALLADAMIRDAVDRGLDPDVARRAVISVITGASQLIGTSAPSDVVRSFVEYGGTTAAAIGAMLDGGLRESVRAGLRAAEARASNMTTAIE